MYQVTWIQAGAVHALQGPTLASVVGAYRALLVTGRCVRLWDRRSKSPVLMF